MLEEVFTALKDEWKAEVMAEIRTMRDGDQRYLTIDQAATYMGCSYEMVRTQAAAGAFPVIALGTQKRVIDKLDIDAYLALLKRKQASASESFKNKSSTRKRNPAA